MDVIRIEQLMDALNIALRVNSNNLFTIDYQQPFPFKDVHSTYRQFNYFMAKERLCGFKVGASVQLQVEVELLGKHKAPKYTIKNVYRPNESTMECEYDIQHNEITKPHVKENELSHVIA